MAEAFIGREALSAGLLSRGQLVRQHARLLPGVYLHRDVIPTAVDRAQAAWLWSQRRGVIAGFSASAVYGAAYVDADRPADLLHSNRFRVPGVDVRGDRVRPDEIRTVAGLPVTTPERTAVDLACWYGTVEAVAGLDALARVTDIDPASVQRILDRSRGRRGVVAARESLELIDAGAESPRESWLRVVLIHGGLPRPVTQIPVYDGGWEPFAVVDMGWPELKVGADYDGEDHGKRWRSDARRHERLRSRGWIVIRVVAGDREDEVVRRVRAAYARRAA